MDGPQCWSFAGLNTEKPPESSHNVKETREENTGCLREADPEPSFQNTKSRPDEMPSRARKCWICLDEELPEYVSTGLLGRRRRKIYRSEDPALGRLICPCRCRGSIKYVHEGCIKQWRNQNPEAYRCGRCGYHYQLERLTWAERLRSPLLAMAITVTILITTIFLLGFVADPILSLWIDPVGTIAGTVGSGSLIAEEKIELLDLEEQGWTEHFVKGLFSLGLLGFAKAFLAASPWHWWNFRTPGLGGGTRRAGTGRGRVENISVTLVLIGVVTFLWAVWKGTRSWAERTLDRASERIMNAHRDDESDIDDDDDDDDDNQERHQE